MNIPETLLQRLEENEQVAKKFHYIENKILTILNFQDFFEQLLTEIGQTFCVPHVWISVINESSIAKQIQAMEDSYLLKSNTSFISEKDFMAVTGPTLRPFLANMELTRFCALFPLESDYNLGSIAVAPISLDGITIGSLNQGDSEADRFMPGIDTNLLESLALKISLCLSNVAAHEQLKHLAYHDPLTGLLNRRIMETILDKEFQRSKRYVLPLSIIFIDLDRFKAVNDTFGHDAGDMALIHLAHALRKAKRSTDILARFAGDEFVVILPSTTRIEAMNYIYRVKEFLAEKPVQTENSNFNIALSSGIASIPDPEILSSAELLKLADQRLYLAKKEALTG